LLTNKPLSRPLTKGELQSHEVLGHSVGKSFFGAALRGNDDRSKRKASVQTSTDAIQLTNLYRRCLGIKVFRNGADHDLNPALTKDQAKECHLTCIAIANQLALRSPKMLGHRISSSWNEPHEATSEFMSEMLVEFPNSSLLYSRHSPDSSM